MLKTWHDSIKIIRTKDDLKSLTDILFPIMALVAADRLRPEYDSEEEFIEFFDEADEEEEEELERDFDFEFY